MYNSRMQSAIKADKNGASSKEYMQALSQNIIINVDSSGKAVVETDKGKPPKVSTRKTSPGWGA